MSTLYGYSKKTIIFLFCFVLLSDQLSKLIVLQNCDLFQVYKVFPFLNIVHLQNKGAIFGVLKNFFSPAVFIVISLLMLIFLIDFARKNIHNIKPLTLIFAGAIGNILDRIFHGAVIDFLDFHVLGYHWPAFNIADSAIVIGVAILFFKSFKESSK